MIYAIPIVDAQEEAALARIEGLRKELRYYIAEPRQWVGSVRRVLAARAIQGSNSIEGFNVSVEDAIAAVQGEEPEDATLANRHAVLGYQRAMTYVIQLAPDPHFRYEAALIRSLHFMITEYSSDADPGRWRQRPIWVRNDRTGEVVYEAPDEKQVPDLINELIEQLSTSADVPAMIRGAIAHLNLVMIHPFRDGNGRMARCLQTLVLAREQILAQEFCSIEEYLGRNTESYYKILGETGRGSWQPEGDARPWVRYCLTAHYIQARSVVRRVRESEAIWAELDELRRRHHLSERTMSALFDAAIGLRVKNSSYRAQLRNWGDDISTQLATNDLKGIVNAGLLQQVGQKRGTHYAATKAISDVTLKVRAGRQPLDATNLFNETDPAGTAPMF
jgi:Fic family protein